MKKIMLATVAILALSASSVWAQGAFRIGGGMYFDDNMPGGSIAVDIPIGEGNLAISP